MMRTNDHNVEAANEVPAFGFDKCEHLETEVFHLLECRGVCDIEGEAFRHLKERETREI